MTCDSCGNKEIVWAFELEVRVELNCIGVSRLVELKLHTQTIMHLLPKLFPLVSSNQLNMESFHQVKFIIKSL
jgi:hypothetical protein